jgi:DNA modification methylase
LIQKRKLSELKQDSKNANRGTASGSAMIEESLRSYGAGRSVLVDRNGNLIAGNKTAENARKVGIEDVIIVPTDGKTLVAVQRMDLDINDHEARELAIADNRAGQVSLEWDPEVLRELDDNVELGRFFTDAELEQLLGADAPIEAPPARIEIADELEQKWKTKPGQLWRIPSRRLRGKYHAILCGDSLKQASADKVMAGELARMCFTDPPWNVAVGDKHNRSNIANDKMSGSQFAKFLQDMTAVLAKVVEHDLYCVMSSSEWPSVDQALRSAFHFSSTLIWVKDQMVMSRGKYHRRYEPIWYGWRDSNRSSYVGNRKQQDIWNFSAEQLPATITAPAEYGAPLELKISLPGQDIKLQPDRSILDPRHGTAIASVTVKYHGVDLQDDIWHFPRPKKSAQHPTMKPVELVVRALKNSSEHGDIVFEPFSGGASTMAACELTGRVCRAIELLPKYVAVALERMTEMGLKPELASEKNIRKT